MRQKGFSSVFIILGIVGILVVALYLFSQSKSQISQTPQQQKTNNTSDSPATDKKITYQSEVNTASNSSKTVFIERDSSEEALYTADNNLSKVSKKLIYKFDLPGAMGFTPPVITAGDYLIMPYAGGDANDIVIFTPEGKLVTAGVSQSNPDIMSWQVSYKFDTLKDNKVEIQLFRIDNSRAEALIDLSTGKIDPGSFKNLPKAK